MKVISNFETIKWSGGDSIELFILPESADYKDLDFDLRVSVATVEVEESTFTPLPNVYRTLTVIDGEHALSVNNGDFQKLNLFRPFSFEGTDLVSSQGQSVNFNLMSTTGTCPLPQVLNLMPTQIKNLSQKQQVYILLKGEICIDEVSYNKLCVVFLDPNDRFTISESSRIIHFELK